ncbi:histidinol-phosphatase HisJ [Paenalkalicoccus suaedae]|uniref:Histidinol-phosphatase n=1 Tax=Paenalkalicoccus suaedae TaxID=2592382 RepID=A0A859FG40_9BACI|nr:histidinol-phosphatase HisJ [Paenalkalicoccus suaedae]QKS72067.1 histidinol-phosphatase HisJ [Paenalkalicoccus suaedae]
MITYDRHVHTPFCPHGSPDTLQQYCERAIELGLKEISFTEHAPLPPSFRDPVPDQDSAMSLHDLEAYFTSVEKVKQEYKGRLLIRTGLEVDYIAEFEHETKAFLNEYGDQLDDGILSVHFLKVGSIYECMDLSKEAFGELVTAFGGVQNVYKEYYQAVLKSIQSDLGIYKPNRIGHMTLARKFQVAHPRNFNDSYYISEVLEAVAKKGYALDLNTAGLRKEHCLEIYPDEQIQKQAKEKQIPLIYGSDSHDISTLGADREIVEGFATT